MKNIYLNCGLLWLGLAAAGVSGQESYSELMARAEKLTSQKYDPSSRAFQIKSEELDAILDSGESRPEKMKRLKLFIRELENHREKQEEKSPSPEIKNQPGNPIGKGKAEADPADPETLYQTGLKYWLGRQVPRSIRRALWFFRKSAAQNHQPSQFMLAAADLQGKGVIPDPKKAFSRFSKLYHDGFTAAGIPLGIQYCEGNGTGKNYVLAVEHLLKGLPFKNKIPLDFAPEAALGKMYYYGGYGMQPDFPMAFRYLKQGGNHPEIQYLLGTLYRDGKGTTKDLPSAAKCFRIAAEKGNLSAGMEIGKMHYRGEGVKKDDLLAVRFLTPAAEKNHPGAALLLAEICSDEKSPARDEKRALQYFRLAAREGNADALYRCGFLLLNGIGTEKDAAGAAEYLRPAAEQGHAEAAFLCGKIEEAARHEKQSAAYYRRAAEAGHSEAIRKFADMALNGRGMKADPELAIRYLKKLAEKGNSEVLEQLAALYESGIGPVKPDLREAVRYYSAAAEKGSIRSQVRLGWIYHALGQPDKALSYAEAAAKTRNSEAILLLAELRKNDRTEQKKQEESLRQLQELADQGNRQAARQLGIRFHAAGDFPQAEKYLRMLEAEKDPEILFLLGDIACRRTDGKADCNRAFHLLSQAAEAGHLRALIELGRMYHRGQGVRQDFKRALNCYRRAAEKNLPEGMFLTGCMFYNGEGTSPDYAEAYRWFRQAAEKGNVLAMQYLAVMFKEGIGVPKNNREAIQWRERAIRAGK